MKFGTHEMTLLYGTTHEFTLGDLSIQVHLECTNYMGSGHDLWMASVCFKGTPLLSSESTSGQDALDEIQAQVECLRPLLEETK